MRSGRAKVLHRVGGLPLVTWAVRAVRPLAKRVQVVIGHERDAVREALASEGVTFAVQERQLGTGHALVSALPLPGASTLIVLAGDVPGLTTATLERMLDLHATSAAAATLLTFRPDDPAGYGRIVRDADGGVRAIVEDALATAEERAIGEVNAALYAFDAAAVLPLLADLPPRGRSGEIFLTDVIEQLAGSGRRVFALEVAEDEVAGINTQAQLAQAEDRYRRARALELMDAGVTLVDPANVVVEADATVGAGSSLGPFVTLQGRTRLGERCEIGPLVCLHDVIVGDGAVIRGPLSRAGGEIPAGATIEPA